MNVNALKWISITWACGKSIQAPTCALCVCQRVYVSVFITPCMHAAALPTGIHSFRHIFTSSAFKGINIAPAVVAGLNGWLGGVEQSGGAECQKQSLRFSFLPSSLSSSLFLLLLPSDPVCTVYRGMRYRYGSAPIQDPEPSVLCSDQIGDDSEGMCCRLTNAC